jgi:GNAT superfamily N-acetyltransferase
MCAMDIRLRPHTPADLPDIARILYAAFRSIAERHNFPLDFPTPEVADHAAKLFGGHPKFFGVVAEADGRLVGSNFLDERDPIPAVGPITVDPAYHGKGVGRRLMEAVIERGRGAAGVRLVQDAFNTTSMSLYTSLGFDAKEPLALLAGRPALSTPAGAAARAMTEADLPACAALCRHVHGFDRTNELRDALTMFGPAVLVRDGRVTAYASAPGFWFLNHGVGETDEDLAGVVAGAGAAMPAGGAVSMLVPIRRSALFRGLLAAGMRVVKPMTLMAMGQYQEPAGAFYPSVGY